MQGVVRGKLEELSSEILNQDPSRPALEHRGTWLSWGEMRAVANRVADLIHEATGNADANVALMARCRPSAIAAMLGLFATGRTVQMVHVYQKAAGIVRDVDKLKPVALVAAREDLTEELVAALTERNVAAVALEDMGAELVGAEDCSGAASAPDALERHLYVLSSGTTGTPKHITISYDMLAEHMVGQNSALAKGVTVDAAPPKYLYAPLGNISGLLSVSSTILKGDRAIISDRFKVEDWVAYVRRFRPKFMGLPAAGIKMVVDANVPAEDLASVEWIPTGAAPVDPEVKRAFEDRYGCVILLSYGATEFVGTVCAMTPELHTKWGKEKVGSIGRALPGVQLRVVDQDTGDAVEPGTEGILEVLAERVGSDWFRTSDLVVIDADGFMFHRGRADGAINRGGFKILPEAIENALRSHEAISEVAVVGVPDDRLGQVPAAAVAVRSGAERPSEGELEAHLRERVLATYIPVRWMFLEEMPRTASLKIDRGALQRFFDAQGVAAS